MEFTEIVQKFTAAVEAGDGAALAALFCEDGVYHDTFYGEFKGRAAIAAMLEERFHGDAKDFLWEAHKTVREGNIGYASWNFSYTATLPGSEGKRVVAEGMSCFDLADGLIRHYSEKLDSGMALSMLDFPPERLLKLFRRWNDANRDKPALKRHFSG